MNRKTALYLIMALAGVVVLVAGFLIQWSRVKDGPGVDLLGQVGAWVGAVCVFAILSYLYKENPVYRTFEHITLGLGLGYAIAIVIRQMLVEKWWNPMSAGFKDIISGGATGDSYWDACLIFAAVLGLLWYCQYSKKYLWLSRITIGVTAGAGAGLAIRRVSIETFPQITSTFKNIFIRSELAPNLSAGRQVYLMGENLVFLVIVCCVLYYFFFSFRRDSALAKAPANMGRFFLMISFGAFFGNTFMTRVVILIDRVNFLLHDWLRVQ